MLGVPCVCLCFLDGPEEVDAGGEEILSAL
jgi:hypothetical protein